MSDLRLHLRDPHLADPGQPRLPFGRYLVNQGIIAQSDLVHALELQCYVDAPLGEIMISEGLASRPAVMRALSRQHGAQLVNLEVAPPALHLATRLPSAICLQHGMVPWLQLGDTLLVATSRPDRFDHFRACMGAAGRKLLPVIADELQIQTQLSRLYGAELAQRAATRVRSVESCRTWDVQSTSRRVWALTAVLLCATLLFLTPHWTLTVAMLLAFTTLLMTTALKAAAFWSQLSNRVPDRPPPLALGAAPFRLPRVSVLVPLLHEKEIAGALIARLSRLTYPKSLLNVVLVLEAGDTVTRETIARTDMPDWMSVIEVPEANRLTTEPRALNYALDFCRGSIIGVWDAEDAPEPDQIERVVSRFQQAPENVACLQGILDYYNSRSNWISRCFTIEYASWWRVILPGIARMGLVIPLGGTTLFFRRNILETLGGWDAHNVTEDADLGVRLARHGYVTELLPTVTYEEATSRVWPWMRQRSRWLKGFLITWCVHMRNPAKLYADLGCARFLGVQTMLLATFIQFAFAPLLWSFWVMLFGLTHPIETTLGTVTVWAMIVLFIFCGIVNLCISILAVSGKSHRHLLGWVLTMLFYFPMGAVAAFKGLHECVVRPFFWDKTQHGVTPKTRVARPLATEQD